MDPEQPRPSEMPRHGILDPSDMQGLYLRARDLGIEHYAGLSREDLIRAIREEEAALE